MADLSKTIGQEMEAAIARAEQCKAAGDSKGARTALLKASELALRYAQAASAPAVKKQRLDRAKSLRQMAENVVAKVERDQQYDLIVSQFEDELGPIRGGGYANRNTAAFLQAYFDRHGQLPPGVRESWSWSVLRDLHRRLAGVRPIQPAQQLWLPATRRDPR